MIDTAALLKCCGGGKVLDVACGAGARVRDLLRQGVDAHGVDADPANVAAAERLAPGRVTQGALPALPCPDAAFDTVVAAGVLERLASPADVAVAFKELRRVARRAVFLEVDTAPTGDGPLPATLADRAWWETRAFEAGFRKHPLHLRVTPYDELDGEGPRIVVVLEPVPGAALAEWPLSRLAAERDLRMDMLRESGRRADAHVVRYDLAAELVGPGHVVLDAACGLGYGSALIARRTEAARVVGLDMSAEAAAYARASFGALDPRLEFRAGDATDLSAFADASVDVVVSFETIEHLPDHRPFLAEVARVLKPGGRFVASVPNLCVDETGRDPNPFHFHVFDWTSFRALFAGPLAPSLAIERQFSQNAGGGMREPDARRTLTEIDPDTDGPGTSEWCLAVAIRSPFAAVDPAEKAARAAKERHHVRAWWRDYDNPWLVDSLVNQGSRVRNPRLLAAWVGRLLAEARPGSPDQGAALCIRAYRLLERPDTPWDRFEDHLRRIEAYMAAADGSWQARRWQVSLLYAAGLTWRQGGFLERALDAFAACAARDIREFSATLGTKTVSASLEAGRLALTLSRPEEARRHWRRGMAEANRLLQGDWSNVWGDPDRPFWVETRETAEVVDLAMDCVNALATLDAAARQPGLPHEKTVWGRRGFSARIHELERERSAWKAEIARLNVERAAALSAQGRTAEAASRFAQAASHDAGLATWSRALHLLRDGRLAEGWEWYDKRFAAGRARARTFAVPPWRGEDLSGERVLVWREQGIGEEILFAGLYPDLIARAGHVAVECERRLVPLFARSFPQATIRAETTPDAVVDVDRHVPAGSLARHLRPGLDSFPERPGYLVADPHRVAFWRARLAGLGDGPKVGICWRSRLGPHPPLTTLEQWAPVFGTPGVRFITLQYDPSEDEIAAAERRSGIRIARWPDLDLLNDFDGIAALMTALDAVVTVPTVVGDLAGALGRPVWRCGWSDDWATLGTGRRPWTPSMRLLYAAPGQRLDGMLAQAARELTGWRDVVRAHPPA